MNDLEIRQYEESIINTINSKALPLEIKRLIVKDILILIENELSEELSKLQSVSEQEEV